MAAISGLSLTQISAAANALVPEERDNTNGVLYKKNDPQWVKSLYERGVPTVYAKSRNELRYIGMPVGGINAGGVYLGGDGRLWLWDIFNDTCEGVEPKIVKWQQRSIRSRDGACYVEPAQNIRPLEQGFALRFEYNGKTTVKYLRAADWDEILFEAGYPVGTVRYIDRSLPVETTLHAYSPFIPLNEDESGLPATILSFSFKNTGISPVKISVTGWLENKTGIRSAYEMLGNYSRETLCRRNNRTVAEKDFIAVDESLVLLSEQAEEMKTRPDFGTMCIAALRPDAKACAAVDLDNPDELFDFVSIKELDKPVQEPLIGAVQSDMELPAGASLSRDFVISWYFPNLKIYDNIKDTGRYYQNRFSSALAVAQYIQQNFERLSSQTLLWAATWKDSTL
ncbi:MAG: hypothetical protein LBS42_06465, partial [Tannerella sp.]|nr:hypothetical protein [Tannerella sp.]